METALTPARRRLAGLAAVTSSAATLLGATVALATPQAPVQAPARAAAPQATAAQAAAAQPATAQELLDKLRRRIEAVDARLDGVLGVYVEDLSTGARIERRADDVFPTASSIKLAVLYELYRQAAEKRLDLLTLVSPPAHPVPSEGILRFMQPGTQLTLHDLGLLVMALSDNEAANELIRRVGMESVNRRLDELSLTSTRLRRLMLDLEAARQGRENVSTPRQLATLARLVATGHALPPALAAELLALASVPDPGSFFRRGIPEGPRAVTKLGTLDGVRCEAAWVDVPGRPYAAALMTSYLKRDKDGEDAIAEISAAVYETFDRLARSSAYGRAIAPRQSEAAPD